MGKLALYLSAVSSMLLCFACNKGNSDTQPSWQSEYCDTTQRNESFDAIDLVLPFSQTDTLKDLLTTIPQVFMVIVKNGQIKKSIIVTASSLKERPYTIAAPSTLPHYDTLTWLDRTYLWTLADRPDYPYNRYEPLLKNIRQTFVLKRDSMMQLYLQQHPNHSLRIQSDLRGSGYQRRHLTMGKSATPLSQHNFGLASDIAILHKNRQLQNIQFYKTFLGDLGKEFGLTWGGTFLGFIDPNHVQYYPKTADMLAQLPALRFEYEPYRIYFKNRVKRMTAAGKAAKIEDTKALLTTLAKLHRDTPCVCDTLADRPTPTSHTLLAAQLRTKGYQPKRDVLLIGDLDKQTTTLFHPTGNQKTLRLGKWQ